MEHICHLSTQKQTQAMAQDALQALCDHHEFLKQRVEPGPEAIELVDAIHVYIDNTIQTWVTVTWVIVCFNL